MGIDGSKRVVDLYVGGRKVLGFNELNQEELKPCGMCDTFTNESLICKSSLVFTIKDKATIRGVIELCPICNVKLKKINKEL